MGRLTFNFRRTVYEIGYDPEIESLHVTHTVVRNRIIIMVYRVSAYDSTKPVGCVSVVNYFARIKTLYDIRRVREMNRDFFRSASLAARDDYTGKLHH